MIAGRPLLSILLSSILLAGGVRASAAPWIVPAWRGREPQFPPGSLAQGLSDPDRDPAPALGAIAHFAESLCRSAVLSDEAVNLELLAKALLALGRPERNAIGKRTVNRAAPPAHSPIRPARTSQES